MNQSFLPSDRAMLSVSHAAGVAEIVGRWKAQGLRVGFVPTMGALHEGHLSLVRLARRHADRVVASVFVNPAQFAPHEDFDAYPRDPGRDLRMLQGEGVDMAYTPGIKDIYPDGVAAASAPGGGDAPGEAGAASGLESDFRPHFFAGVRTVVRILLAQVRPDIAVFGEKDYQQLMVIREMAAAESLPVDIIGAPILRDAHGLALSSRNAYLSEGEIEIARMLNQVIYAAAHRLAGDKAAAEGAVLEEARQAILTCGFDRVDYVAARWGRVLAAAWLGRTRLIDNCPVEESPAEGPGHP